MTDRNKLSTLKTIAKRLARAGRIPHHEALDILARYFSHAHWNALTVAWDKGWRPSAEQLEEIENAPMPKSEGDAEERAWAAQHINDVSGEIDGQPYEMTSDIIGVLIGGRGWSIFVDAAPSIEPTVELDTRMKNNPIDNPEFALKALRIAEIEAERVREKIATDWPRRST